MKKLAIIGASYLQLPVVQRAKQLGIETHCFAWEEGAVCKDIANYFYPISVIDKEKILEECRKIGIDGITTIATDMVVPTICYVAEKLGLVSNSYESALKATNKGLMRLAFKGNNINIPNFVILNKSIDYISGFNTPLIVKPVDRSGSCAVTKIDDFKFLRKALDNAINNSFSKEAIVEEFIEGFEISVESISWNGNHYILAITDKVTTGQPHFVELAHHQPSQLPLFLLDKIKIETLKVLDALDIKYGASHAEFKITKTNEVFIIEVGARMGGDFIGSHLVELSTGYDFMKGVIDVALNQFNEPKTSTLNYSGVYFLCEETKKILPFFNFKTDFEVEKLQQNQSLKSIKNSNDRSGYIIYQSTRKIELL